MASRRFIVVVVLGLTLGGVVPVGAAPPVANVHNTGLADALGRTVITDSGLVAFEVSEAQSGADLNGDGDTTDSVVHVVDRATGTTANTHLAIFVGDMAAVGSRVAFEVSEASQGGTDLNGDGDAADNVVHVFDPAAGVTANTALATLSTPGALVAVGDRVAFAVDEFSQGNIDLNGDGDDRDAVVHVFDPATGTATNTGLNYYLGMGCAVGFVGGMVAVGDRVAFDVWELEQGAKDLNGDGDFTDAVLHVFDAATGTVTNTNLAAGSRFLAPVGENRLAFFVHEGHQNTTDLNGDGDNQTDEVAHVLDLGTGVVTNIGLAVGLCAGPWSAAGRAVFGVAEAAQGGADLNGDGDTTDSVVYGFDPATGVAKSSGLAFGNFEPVAVGTRVAFDVSEVEQGGTDLNGDGDATDSVVHVFDPATGTAASTGLALTPLSPIKPVAVGDRVAVVVAEAIDLNGDGDALDTVMQLFDPATSTATNTALATRWAPATVGEWVALGISEADQGRTDLNGNGDFSDDVVHVFDPTGPTALNLELAMGTLFVAKGDVVSFGVKETAGDLNGDGDKADTVRHVVKLSTAAPSPPPPTAPNIGLVDISQGMWYLRNSTGVVTSFFYGNPVDLPISGDWDGDGDSTPGLYRQSDGFFYARNSNSQGPADHECFAGDPADIPLSGDWDGDGDDNLGIYRPSEQRFYLFTTTCTGSPMGAAQISFLFGNPGDKPVAGDWDGDGIDEIGLHRESTGFFYWRNTLDTGIASGEIFFGDPGDRFVSGDWGIVDGRDTPAIFRPSDVTYYFRHTLTQGIADSQFTWSGAGSAWLPVAGGFGLG